MHYLFLAEGFEEIEALATLDILRRLELPVRTVSITGDQMVEGAHGLRAMTETRLSLITRADAAAADSFILPGGMPCAAHFMRCTDLAEVIAPRYFEGALLAAICAAPIAPATWGLLIGRRATCYPTFKVHLSSATYTAARVEEDKNLITACGPSAAIDFAFAIGARFASAEKIAEVRQGMLFAD